MERAERVFYILFAFIIEWAFFAIQVQYMGETESTYFSIFPILFLIYVILCGQTVYARINWTYRWLTGKISDEEKAELAESLKKTQERANKEIERRLSEQ